MKTTLAYTICLLALFNTSIQACDVLNCLACNEDPNKCSVCSEGFTNETKSTVSGKQFSICKKNNASFWVWTVAILTLSIIAFASYFLWNRVNDRQHHRNTLSTQSTEPHTNIIEDDAQPQNILKKPINSKSILKNSTKSYQDDPNIYGLPSTQRYINSPVRNQINDSYPFNPQLLNTASPRSKKLQEPCLDHQEEKRVRFEDSIPQSNTSQNMDENHNENTFTRQYTPHKITKMTSDEIQRHSPIFKTEPQNQSLIDQINPCNVDSQYVSNTPIQFQNHLRYSPSPNYTPTKTSIFKTPYLSVDDLHGEQRDAKTLPIVKSITYVYPKNLPNQNYISQKENLNPNVSYNYMPSQPNHEVNIHQDPNYINY